MTCTLLEKLDLPKSCHLGTTIYKKQFLTSGDFSPADKKLLSGQIGKVIWQASLKPDTINISPYQDNKREYEEIEVIEVLLNEISKVRRIAEIIMRSIPYPILLQLTYEEQIMIAAGHSRTSQSDNSKNTIEEFLFTEWIILPELTLFQTQFFENIHSSQLSFFNFFCFYDDIIDQMILLNASQWANCYFEKYKAKEIKGISDRIMFLKKEMEELRAALKQESQFNRKVELNVAIKKIERQIEAEIWRVRPYG